MSGGKTLKKGQIKSLVLLGLVAGEVTFCSLLIKGIVTDSALRIEKEIEEKIESGQRVLDRAQEISELYKRRYADLETLSSHVPKATDPYAWAYEYTSERSQRAQISLSEVEEVKSKGDEDDAEASYYQIRVALDCSYKKTIEFLNYLENDNPLLLVKSLEINTNKDDPLAHSAEMLLQWPLAFVIETGK